MRSFAGGRSRRVSQHRWLARTHASTMQMDDAAAAAAAAAPTVGASVATTPPTLLSALVQASPVLRAAEELVPGGSAIVAFIAALSLAVIVQSLATPSADEGDGKKLRRRSPHCDLAIVPDGSKDKPDRVWKKELSPEVFASLRGRETDPPNLPTEEGGFDDDDSLMDDGVFECAGCGSVLYDNDTRFEAGCGWPCFFTCMPDAVRERQDADGTRMELVCNACEGHLGHIFRNEGWESLPEPRERHCVNARSLRFVARPRAEGEAEGEGEEEWIDPIDDVE